MCKCTPNIRTPFCGKLGCEWPKPEGTRSQLKETCCAKKIWGIGTTTDSNGESISYGFPVTNNPLRFHPDYEVCSDEEIENHEAACAKKAGDE